MRLSIISFTENGKRLSEHIAELFKKKDSKSPLKTEPLLFTKCEACKKSSAGSPVLFVEKSVGDWAKEQMQEKNALLFIGAC